MDDIFSEYMDAERKKNVEKPDYEKTTKEKREEWILWFKNILDWKKAPLTVLFYCILLIGAVLMYLSIYSFTGNVLVAVLSVAFTEGGIVSWKNSVERAKNTEEQLAIAKAMRTWHILVAVVLLVANLGVETAQQTLDIKIDGAVWIIFGLMGLTSLLDMWNYIAYLDKDREGSAKRKFSQKVAEMNASTMEKQLEAKRKAAEIEANAHVEYMEKNAPKIAQLTGQIKAAKKLRETYSEMGLTPEEVDSLLARIEKPLSPEKKESEKQEQKPSTRQYVRSGKFKRDNSSKKEVEKEKENFLENSEPNLELEKKEEFDFS